MRPVATATSSIEYPRAPATAPAYLKVSPILATSVLVLVAAAARTSEKCSTRFWASSVLIPLSEIPKAVISSVTMSDTVPRSSPDADARSITDEIPARIWSVFQPAMPMYCMASPTCVAVYLVSVPSCLALSLSAWKSSPVAPVMALTVLIWLSKLVPTLTA